MIAGNTTIEGWSLRKEVPMFLTRFAVLALASTFAAAAWAESNTMTGRPGFFKPTPDGNSSISQTLPETIPDVAKQAVADVTVATVAAEPKRRARSAREMRETEADLDRAQVEHERMRERS